MEDELVDCLAEFIKLESSNFHDHEFDILVRGMIDRGRRMRPATSSPWA